MTARSRHAQELAILKLYAVLSQAHFVKQQAADWEGAFLGILALPFPLFLKHTADVVIHPDRGYSNMVSHVNSCDLMLSLQEIMHCPRREQCHTPTTLVNIGLLLQA